MESWSAAYGAMPAQQLEAANYIVKLPSMGRQRMKMNVIAIFVSLFAPWLLFTGLYAIVSFHLHFATPVLCWILVAVGVLMAFALGGFAAKNGLEFMAGSPAYQPTWLTFLFLTTLLASLLGPLLGNQNYWLNMAPYYNLQNLNDYSSVDPTRMRGQQMMDAGRVQFLSGATVDLRRAYAFQNLDTYCVAPITMYDSQMGAATPLSTYDFWAVGINCCSGDSTHVVDFRCGAYNVPGAHQGLRLMADEQRSFFRLAVQQAESAHMIKAVHPLFFSWTNDAPGDMHGYLANAFSNFASCMCVFFVIQLCLVLIVTYCLSKWGYNDL